jgi:uncharacterized protein
MLQQLSFIVLCINLVGCSAQLTERGFIAQDPQVTQYSAKALADWQQQLSTGQLQQISVTNHADPAQLTGLWLDHPASDELIFIIQGNGMRVSDGGIEMMKQLAALGKDLVMFDRRGVGASTGHATIANLSSDAKRQAHYLKQTIKPTKLIVHGYSLGSFVAAELVKSVSVEALVLQGTATNVDDWLDARMPWYSKLFVTLEVDEAFKAVDNETILAQQYQGPLLIIAGAQDQQAPAQLAAKLFASSRSSNKQLMMVKQANHGNMLDKPEQMQLYQAFLRGI